MIDWLRETSLYLASLNIWPLVGIWLVAVAAFVAVVLGAAHFDRMPRRVYRWLFQPLEICVAAGPAAFVAGLGFQNQQAPGGAVYFIMALLTFFAGILALEQWCNRFWIYAANRRSRDNRAS